MRTGTFHPSGISPTVCRFARYRLPSGASPHSRPRAGRCVFDVYIILILRPDRIQSGQNVRVRLQRRGGCQHIVCRSPFRLRGGKELRQLPQQPYRLRRRKCIFRLRFFCGDRVFHRFGGHGRLGRDRLRRSRGLCRSFRQSRPPARRRRIAAPAGKDRRADGRYAYGMSSFHAFLSVYHVFPAETSPKNGFP